MRYIVVSNPIEGELNAESISNAEVVATYSTSIDKKNPRKAYHYAREAARYHRKATIIHQKSEFEFVAL